jgi:putative tricarboxylic transport membrane protein
MQEKYYSAGNLWSGLALTALGAYITAEAWQWEYLGPEGPGPGFLPLWYGIAMLALSIGLVASNAMRKRDPDAGTVAWGETGRALGVWLALLVCIALFKLLGFVTSFGLLCFFIVAVMYRRPLALAAMVAFAGSAGFYILFPFALGVALPVGVFGF